MIRNKGHFGFDISPEHTNMQKIWILFFFVLNPFPRLSPVVDPTKWPGLENINTMFDSDCLGAESPLRPFAQSCIDNLTLTIHCGAGEGYWLQGEAAL